MTFYKKDNNQILVSELVTGPDYLLVDESSPLVDGWIYADNIDQAIAQFALLSADVISNRQCRLALNSIGKYQETLDFINNMSESLKTQALIEWDFANNIQRDNPFFTVIGVGIGLSSEQIDDLFALAKTL